MLLVEECFAAADAGFLDALHQVESPKLLAAFADRWKKDSRPWARAQIFAYLDRPLDSAGHQPLVKHLFKDAEERGDHELMAAFLVAFDVLVRRVRKTRWKWDSAMRGSYQEEYLHTTRDVIQLKVPARFQRRNARLFSYGTRYYLRRRVWRYFRWLGYRRPGEYPALIALALRRYRDADLARGENILDSWALLNVCFRGCAALKFGVAHVQLHDGHSLSELRAAPRFASAWQTPEAGRVLFSLISGAASQLVRTWATELFRALPAASVPEFTADELLALLDHDDERVQLFGASLFENHPSLDKLPVATWLRLLKTQNLTALATLSAAFTKHVSAVRLTLEQCLSLATEQAAPVARLGQSYLTARVITPEERLALSALANARCPALATELARWALAHLTAPGRYDADSVSRFFDSLTAETRSAAWAWLLADPTAPAYGDPILWARLAETPFDDLRLKLIDHLALRASAPGRLSTDTLAPIWCSVLLGVHRGGRQKLKAVQQVAEVIIRDPVQAPKLLPVLAVAVRSIRGPEMRAGLAAVMTLIAIRPELAGAVRGSLPELQFSGGEEIAA